MALTWWVLLQATTVGDPARPLQMALESITVPVGFGVELVYPVPLHEQGSWVALTPDPSGRLITSADHVG
jgi:hypothetical protein